MASVKHGKAAGTVIFYHADCPDGFGGAYAAWKKFGAKADYIPLRHESKLPPLRDERIFFIDIAPQNEDDLRKMMRGNRVTVLDHHVSSKAITAMSEDYRYAKDNSGAVLAWEYFHPGKKTPRLLLYVEDQDLWRFRLPHTSEVFSYLSLFPFDFREWDKIVRMAENPGSRKEAVKTGSLIIKYDDMQIEKLMPTATSVEFGGHKVYAINAPRVWRSKLGHLLAKKKPPFSIVWRSEGDMVFASLRGTGKADLSKLASKYGGGGHHDASAFSFHLADGFPWKIIS